ncbi:hypothetical protein B0H17DRAFT_1274796, partial [Mycena rosella]
KFEPLWFSLDAVVLRADTRIFRVFAAILKAQSSVFADMFTFPQPAAGAEIETMDGIPVIKLHENPDDLQFFLRAIFDSSFFMPLPAKPEFEHIVGILRLSHKYDVPYLRRRALEHLESIYPSSLAEYDSTPKGSSHYQNPSAAFAMLEVCVEVGALWLLPAAYHYLCQLPISSIISAPGWNSLAEKERTACLVGHSAQIQYFPEMHSYLSVETNEDCEDPMECNQVRLEIARDSLQDFDKSMMAPLDLGEYHLDEMHNSGVCKRCMKDSRSTYSIERYVFWDQLPAMFGLPVQGWVDLHEMRQVAFWG